MSNIMEFIRPELFILVIFLYCLGMFMKLFSGFKSRWMIPYILLAVSFVMTLLYMGILMGEGFNGPVIVAAIIESVLIAAVTVFGNELIKQVTVNRQK